MISYCVCYYRPVYCRALIEELIEKTSVLYEILVWINTDDPSAKEFIRMKVAAGVPIRVVGETPQGIGMNAYRLLFQASKYDMIVQVDDDVLRISRKIAESAAYIFARHKEVKYLVTDVWQDEYTTGNRPAMSSYKVYSEEDGLYDGPIDSWFGIYHRSIMPLLMKAPYEKYFYLGSHIRASLPQSGKIGLLCTKLKVMHACGPSYAHAFGLLDFEIEKYRSVNMPGMVEAYQKFKATAPNPSAVLARLRDAERHIDEFQG